MTMLVAIREEPSGEIEAEPVTVHHEEGSGVLTLDDGTRLTFNRAELFGALTAEEIA